MSGIWFDETHNDFIRLGLRVKNTCFSGQSKYQKVQIFETEGFGRVLTLDDTFMTSERDEFLYHEMLVHPAMVTHKAPKRALVIGGGDGGTVRELLSYPELEQVVLIELDEMVVSASKEHLPKLGGDAWDDPRLDVRFIDGIKYVKESQDEKYDIILLDGIDPVGPGLVLYESAFYEGCKRMLKDDGVFALQSETPMLFADVFADMQKRLKGFFKEVHPYFGPVVLYPSGYWSWTWCSNSQKHNELDSDRVAKLAERTRYYNEDIHHAAFAIPNYVKKMLSR